MSKSLDNINKQIKIRKKNIKKYMEEVDKPTNLRRIFFKKQLNKQQRYLEELLEIKQDLEVLEILRKHLFIYTDYGDIDYGEYESKSICINEIHECFCKEYFNKIKQWLEENEE